MNDVANYVFFDNRIAYLNANNLKVYTANLDGSNIKLFGNMYGYMYDDNDYLYVDNFLKTFNKQYHIDDKTPLRQIEVYNANGKMVNSIDIPNVSLLYMFGGNSDYFFLSDEYELDSDEYGPRKALWVIDKRSIKDQDITPKKVFEFIPENQFPGFVLTE